MSNDYPKVIIDQQPIELCKLLKVANLVGGGGEAKIVITQGYVYLNGEVELQKRKKILSGDIIEFNGEVVEVEFQEKLVTPSTEQNSNNSTSSNKKSNKKQNKVKQQKEKNNSCSATQAEQKKKTRKPISF